MFERILFATAALATAISAASAQGAVQGRLEDGDQQLSLNEYHDVYTFEGVEGQALLFEVVSPDFLPGGELIDPSGVDVYHSLGNAFEKRWAKECTLTATGTWQIVVFQSYWLEGDYSLSISPVEATPDVPRCDE